MPVDDMLPQHDLDAMKLGKVRRTASPRGIEITEKGYEALRCASLWVRNQKMWAELQARLAVDVRRMSDWTEVEPMTAKQWYDAGYAAGVMANKPIVMPPPSLPEGWDRMSRKGRFQWRESVLRALGYERGIPK